MGLSEEEQNRIWEEERERARLLGGEAQWESVKGQGTTVTIKIPLGRRDRIWNGKKS